MSFLDQSGHAIQLLLALGGALVLFILAFTGYARALFIGLIVMVPFQPIASKYGSINMVITYVVGFAMLLHGTRHKANNNLAIPLVVPFAFLFFAYFLSWSMAPKMFWMKYAIQLIFVGSNVVLFYMSYAYFRNEAWLFQKGLYGNSSFNQ